MTTSDREERLLTKEEWDTAEEWLKNGCHRDWVEHNGRTATVTNMCGGRYLLTDVNNEVVGLTDDEWDALHYLDTGEIILGRKIMCNQK